MHAILSIYYLLVYILKQCLLVSKLVSNSCIQMILPPEYWEALTQAT